MATREIIHIPDPLLRTISKPVERVDDELRKLLTDMADTMYEAPGIGLAGIQIAAPLRIVVVDCAERAKREDETAEAEGEAPAPDRDEGPKPEKERKPIFLINPEIVAYSDEPSVYEEGCLSIPDYYADVERPAGCTVKYIDEHGKEQLLEANGLLSTCLQHEVDHLDGKLFIDLLSRLKRDMVVKKFAKIAKQSGKENATPLMVG